VWRRLDDGRRAPCRFQADLGRADGSTIPVGVTASLLRRGSEGLLGVICSFQDLTEIKRMEGQVRQADRLAAIGRLAAGLAHEIRNPIASIRGSIEVLRENLAPQGTDRQLMDIVLRESDRLDGTIAEFLEFSRPRQVQPELTDLGTLVEEVLILLSHQGAAGVRIEKEFPDGTVKAVVDPTMVRQALWNLVRNAVESMPGGGTLRVSVAASPARDAEGLDVVSLSVEDTGVGIAPEHLPHVFEPFYTTKARGTGLGLAIVHRIVEEHAGEIRVERPAGGGSRFTLRLPRRDG
jgi:two-component system sensor histidine kinase PilS (NtrC family)